MIVSWMTAVVRFSSAVRATGVLATASSSPAHFSSDAGAEPALSPLAGVSALGVSSLVGVPAAGASAAAGAPAPGALASVLGVPPQPSAAKSENRNGAVERRMAMIDDGSRDSAALLASSAQPA